MEIEIEPTFQHVTWIVKDFLELPRRDDFYLDSPEFIFCGDSYCLRLYPEVKLMDGVITKFHLRRLSVPSGKLEVYCNVALKSSDSAEDDWYTTRPMALEENYAFAGSWFEEDGGDCSPDGSFTMLCSMWLSEESRAGSSAQKEEEQGGFQGHDAPFSSRSSPPKMELLTEFPCTHVQLTVPKFFDLPREMCDSLSSPEFRFAGDAYCFRFRPNADTDDSDLQLVRLTFSNPEGTVSYRVGYSFMGYYIYQKNTRSLDGSVGFCTTVSKLEEERDHYVRDGTLRLVLFLRMGEQTSA